MKRFLLALAAIVMLFGSSPAMAQGYHNLHTYPQRYGGMKAQEVNSMGLTTIVNPQDLLCSIQDAGMSWGSRKYLAAGEPVAGRWVDDVTFLVMYVIRCGNRVEEGIYVRFERPTIEAPPPAEAPEMQQGQQIVVNNYISQGAPAGRPMATGGGQSYFVYPGSISGGVSWQPEPGDITVMGSTANASVGDITNTNINVNRLRAILTAIQQQQTNIGIGVDAP